MPCSHVRIECCHLRGECWCVQVLHRAQQLSIEQQQANDDGAFEYNNLLRMGIFEAFSGIFNGMSAPKIEQYMKEHAQVMTLHMAQDVWQHCMQRRSL